ncbi:hypothetical protein [Virgibacillus kimchii]
MRNKIIDFFLGEPEEVTEGQELMFYAIMGFPVFIAIGTILITL